MRRIFLAVIGGFVGAALGAGAGLAIGALVADYTQVSGFEGEAGYFVVFLFGLPGLLIGLVAGILLSLRWGNRRTMPGAPAPRSTAAGTVGRFAATLAIIAAIVGGGFWLYGEAMDDSIAGMNQATPKLSYEVRLPPGTVLPDRRDAMTVRLFTGNHEAYGNLDDDWRHLGGDRPRLTGWFDLYTRTSHRLLSVALGAGPSPERPAWVFRLRLARQPGHMDAFSPWYPVDFIDDGSDAQPRKATPEDRAEIRYRLVFAGSE